jgi:hypothetical protein
VPPVCKVQTIPGLIGEQDWNSIVLCPSDMIFSPWPVQSLPPVSNSQRESYTCPSRVETCIVKPISYRLRGSEGRFLKGWRRTWRATKWSWLWVVNLWRPHLCLWAAVPKVCCRFQALFITLWLTWIASVKHSNTSAQFFCRQPTPWHSKLINVV